MYIYIYVYIYTHMLLWKQCVLPVITTVALWQLMYLGTWCTVTSCAQVDRANEPYIMCPTVVINRRAQCFHDSMYITLVLLLWDVSWITYIYYGTGKMKLNYYMLLWVSCVSNCQVYIMFVLKNKLVLSNEITTLLL